MSNLPPIPEQPQPGSFWRHEKTGGIYQVVTVGYMEATLDLCVIYRSLRDETTWVRPWSQFSDGRFQHRD